MNIFSFAGRKEIEGTKSTRVLRDMEISLRTNNIEWVHQFLDEDNSGLDVLVNYLLFSHSLMKLEEHEQEQAKIKEQSDKLNDSSFKGRWETENWRT